MDITHTISIAICDDHQGIHDIVEELLHRQEKEHHLSFIIRHYYTGEEYLEAKDESPIVFMDIDMPQMDGIETAKQMEKLGNKRCVIILTALSKRFKDAFKIGAKRFVTKPIEEEEFLEAFEFALQSLIGYQTFPILYEGNSVTIPQREIKYLEASKDYVKVYFKNHMGTTNQTMIELSQCLDERLFVRTHRSYYVNLMYVTNVYENALEVSNTRIEISRRNKKEVKQKIVEYEMKYT